MMFGGEWRRATLAVTMQLGGKWLRSGFLRKARSEARAYPKWICKRRTTKPLRKKTKQTRPIRLHCHGLGAASVGLFLLFGCLQLGAGTNLRGSLGIHDPSTVIQCNGRYYVFGTGNGIISRSSADKEFWTTGPVVFNSAPAWVATAVPGAGRNFWAPDVIYFNGLYHLYYSASTFGSQVSAIGLVTNPTLDPNTFGYQWTDQGPVIQSNGSVTYNTIDPSLLFDTSSNLWMSFGSFFSGVKLIQLDATTGLRSTTNLTVYSLANNSSIEASYLYHHGSYYYLFVNFGTCCAGVDSTYTIRVGRSASITGPYLDRNNANMNSGGGTVLDKTTGKYIGPGHIGILEENGVTWFGSHYYDANDSGVSKFDFEPLYWGADNWPSFTNDWSAVYRFQSDARDDNDQYYGLLQNGASVKHDPDRGNVLDLNGTNQFVTLPDGVGNAQTIATVFKWNGGADWQRVFDFGRTNVKYTFLTPRSASGNLRFTITTAGQAGEKTLERAGAAPIGQWTHVAVTTDATGGGSLYVNGVLIVNNHFVTSTMADIVPTNCWLGRSQFGIDPYFNGQISSVRVYGRALSAAEIVAPQPFITQPPKGAHFQPGTTLQFHGNAADFADVPLSSTGLTWTVEYRDTNTANVVFGPLTGVDGGSYNVPADPPVDTNAFYRIWLRAADTLGRAASNYVDVLPSPTNTDWQSFYTFENGATDSSNVFNGTLQGGAGTITDSIRGPVLSLSGANQYVSLPQGIGAMRTFAAWVKWSGGADWQRIFDFGPSSTRYAMLTAHASNGPLRFEITANGSGERRFLDAPSPLPINVWTHVAVALDGRQAILFVNGQAVAVNSSVNLLPSDVLGSANYIGRSHFSDPYFQGQMDSVQIASRAMTIDEITASKIDFVPGANGLTLSWPAWDAGPILHSANSLAADALWSPVTDVPLTTNGVRILTITPTNDASWFRLQLP